MRPTGTVTFLFTDVEGSTRLARENREDWDAIQKRHHAILRQSIESCGGYVFQIVGDAFCAAFSTAGEAVRAAVKIQVALNEEPWLENAIVKVRAGLHTGTATIREDGEYQGYLAMSRAQRLLSAAHGGQVLLSLASQELVRDHFPEGVVLRDLGTHRLKDVPQPEHIYQLVIPGLEADFPSIKTLERTGSHPASRLTVRLIGTFEILLDGKPVNFAGRIAQSLFCYLVLHAGVPHRREKLAGMFWPDVTEAKARTYLRHEIWSIRKSLPSEDKQAFLITDDIAVTFNPSADYWLDVMALGNVKDSASTEDLMDALAHYRGDFLPGFYDEWITLEREHLQAVFEKRMARLLDLLENEQRWKEILEWAERWISLGQGPEAAYRALMIAYDGLGEPAKVASAFRRCLEALREQNLEPSEQTRALAFKRTSRLKIPVPLTSFIGREKELEEVAKMISESRLVTLTGSGGVGKTRLAIQVVADVLELFPDGVWFLDLAPVMDPALVPNTLAGVLDLQQMGGQDLSYTDLIIGYLRSRRALIIFDNCEHLIEACAEMAHSLLISCEHLSILATSREPLRVSGEVPYRVPSLSIPELDIESFVESLRKTESVRLFTERASVTGTGFAVGPQNALAIAKICQRLDGIPLAIELAAARVDVLGVEQILNRLDDRFNLLTSGSRSALPRHQTLRATIEWSYDLLSEKERLLFQRLAVFIGGWTLEAAEAVCSGDGIETGEILNLLSQLVDKSLALVQPSNTGVFRYRRLETIRQFACEKMLESREANELRNKHYAYFLHLAEKVDRELQWTSKAWKDQLESDDDNFRTALEWCLTKENTEAALRLLGSWEPAGGDRYSETCGWFKKIRALPNVRNYPSLYARLLNHIGYASWLRRNFPYAESVLQESLAIWRKLGEAGEEGLAETLVRLGDIMLHSEEDFKTSHSVFEQSLTLFQKHGNERGVSQVLFSLGNIALYENHYEEAEERFTQSLSNWRKLGDHYEVSRVLNGLGELARLQDDYERAGKFYEQCIKIQRELRSFALLPYPLFNFTWVSLRRGDYRLAKTLIVENLELCTKDGDRNGIIACLPGFASLLGLSSKPKEAARLFGAFESLFRGSGAGLLEPSDQKEIDYFLAAVRRQLDIAEFANAWSEGGEMTIEQAVAFALAETSV